MLSNHILKPADAERIQRGSGVPLYYQIYRLLREKILTSGDLEGEYLPGSIKIAAMLGVSRITTDRALRELEHDRLVKRARPHGTRILHRGVRDKPCAAKFDVVGNAQHVLRELRRHVIRVERCVPPDAVSIALGLRSDEECLSSISLCSNVHDRPVAYCENWSRVMVRSSSDPGFALGDDSDGVFASRVGIECYEHQILASVASVEARTMLELEPASPVLLLKRFAFDQRGSPVEMLVCECHPERFHYVLNQSSRQDA